MNATELRMARAGTYAFIQDRPTEVRLIPHTKQSNGAGGFRLVPGVPRKRQTARLIPQVNGRGVERLGLDGTTLDVDFVLMLPWGAQIGLHDRLSAAGGVWEVVHVRERSDYQVKAELGLVSRDG